MNNKEKRLYNSNTSSNYLKTNVTINKSPQVAESHTTHENTGFTPLPSWDGSRETSGKNLNANRQPRQPIKVEGPITFINATLWEKNTGAYHISFILNQRYGNKETQQTGNMSAKCGRFSDFGRGIIKTDPWYKTTKDSMKQLRDQLTIEYGSQIESFAVNRIMVPVKQSFGTGRNVYDHTGVLLAITQDQQGFARLYVNDQTWDMAFLDPVSDAQAAKGAVGGWRYRGSQ